MNTIPTMLILYGIKAGIDPSINPIIMLYVIPIWFLSNLFIKLTRIITPIINPSKNGITLPMLFSAIVIGCAIIDSIKSYIPITIRRKDPERRDGTAGRYSQGG